MAEEDPPPTPPQGRGEFILFIMSSRQSEATRDLYDTINEILPPYGRQNDRVEAPRPSTREGSYIPLYNVIPTERSDEGSL